MARAAQVGLHAPLDKSAVADGLTLLKPFLLTSDYADRSVASADKRLIAILFFAQLSTSDFARELL